jgi:Protein of unknown function (DUF2568)
MLTAIKYGNLAVAFLLELCALAALGYWGFHTGSGSGTGAKVALGIGAPLLAAIVWGMFVAPKATVKLPAPAQLALKVAIFGLAAAGLALAGQPGWAWAFGLVVVANLALVRALGT